MSMLHAIVKSVGWGNDAKYSEVVKFKRSTTA